MSETFEFILLSPSREVVHASVTEVVLPGYDGDVGILARHENFLGLLGIGALKMVRDGDDYWFLVGSGVYQVQNGVLTVLAETVEKPDEFNVEEARQGLGALSEKLARANYHLPEAKQLTADYQQLKARVEVHRRTELVN